MKIETKMNKNDNIFFLHEKRVIQSVIREISISIADTTEITYLCNKESDQRVHLKVEEIYAFKSKKELLDSL